MKITAKSRYALRFMLELSMNNSANKVKLSEISRNQGLSLKYLESIATSLKSAGFVKAERGKDGGYRLVKNPHEYTVGTILGLMEDSLSPSSCDDCETRNKECNGNCSVIQLRKKLDISINKVLENVTLEDLVKWEKVI